MTQLTPAYYMTVQGRISRFENWVYFQLPIFVISVILSAVGQSGVLQVICGILTLLLLVPNVIGGVRRFHDRDKSGWWMLIAFIPIIGAIWIFVELGFLKGTDGANKYGPDPVATATL